MKTYVSILSLVICLAIFSTVQANTSNEEYEMLYPIFQNGRYGFIDTTGTVRITPQFENYGDFSEGLAPVRKNGRYGYINTRGEFVIPPIYDFAQPFVSGVAVVMLKGVAKHINKQGENLYKPQFTSVDNYYKDVAIATTEKGKVVIDRKGKLLTKAYDDVSVLWNGYILAHNNIKSGSKSQKKYFFIDKEYKEVYGFATDYGDNLWLFADCIVIQTEQYSDDYIKFSYADKSVKHFTSEFFFEEQHNLDDALVAWDPVEINKSTVYNAYLLSTEGAVIAMYKNARIESMGARRYVVDEDKITYMINGKGEKIGENFTYLDNTFSHGRILVKVKGKYQVMDTNGVLYHQINVSELEQHSDYAITSLRKDNTTYKTWKGVALLFDSLLIPCIYDNVNLNYADKGMFVLYKGDQLMYADRKGEIVWEQDRTDTVKPKYVNVDYMMRTAYYAYGEDTEDAIGGHSSSANGPKKIDRAELKGSVKLAVMRSEEHKGDAKSYWQNHTVFNLYLSNDGDSNLVLDAQDSRLYIVMQAKDESGNWKDIEYAPGSWCGNSYHSMILPKGTYWRFEAPIYTGAVKTRIRFKLDIKSEKKVKNQKEQTIYSNEFEGSVNPAQFWRKQGYTPSGLMDTYND